MNYGIGAHENGERHIFAKLAQYYKHKKIKPILFDVGANFGQTIALFDQLFSGCTIHSFEPGAHSYKYLQGLTIKNKSNELILNNFGLSDTPGSATLYSTETVSLSGSSSMYLDNMTNFVSSDVIEQTMDLKTLDNYCQENNITHIDFLKIDIEGNELNCLKGAQTMLKKGNIDFIQFEFNMCAIGARCFFLDFWQLLSAQYDFYRELSFGHGISKIKSYDIFYEQFYATNYFLVKKDICFK